MTPPILGNNDVLIEMRAAGLNSSDLMLRQGIKSGHQPPAMVGLDVTGIVVQVGSACKKYKVGDEVYACNRLTVEEMDIESTKGLSEVTGCCAELVRVAEWKVASKPKSLSFAEAGGVPLAALTAYQGLYEKGMLQNGQNVVILNASSGVGSFAVQFAKSSQCTVLGTCSASKLGYVEDLGGIAVDYTVNSFIEVVRAAFPDGADVVLDCIGGVHAVEAIDILKPAGILVSIVDSSVAEKAVATGRNGIFFRSEASGSQLEEITKLIDSGSCRAPKTTAFDLCEWRDAFELLEEQRTAGKIVLTSAGPADARLRDRADHRLLQLMSKLGMHKGAPAPVVDVSMPRAKLIDHFTAGEAGFEMLNDIIFPSSNHHSGVVEETVTILGTDRNEIDLFISTPIGAKCPLPCIYHIHGGGMVLSTADSAYYVETRNRLAALGMIVVGVQFRNAAGKLGPHPFPAGLNDCMSGLEWVNANRGNRNITKVVSNTS